jgi:anti-sigma B factor antagonist
MSFRVTTSNVEPDIVVLHLSGSITISPEAEALESVLLDLLGEKIRRLVFDLAGIDAIEPAATVFLIRCFFRTRSAGGQLRFAGANEQVLRPFRTAMLDTLLPFDPTVACVCRLRLVACVWSATLSPVRKAMPWSCSSVPWWGAWKRN